MTTTQQSCSGCGTKMPDWPAGWLGLDDGRAYCPQCRKNLYLLQERWGLDIGNTTEELRSDEVLRALGEDDEPSAG